MHSIDFPVIPSNHSIQSRIFFDQKTVAKVTSIEPVLQISMPTLSYMYDLIMKNFDMVVNDLYDKSINFRCSRSYSHFILFSFSFSDSWAIYCSVIKLDMSKTLIMDPHFSTKSLEQKVWKFLISQIGGLYKYVPSKNGWRIIVNSQAVKWGSILLQKIGPTQF